MFKIDLSDNLKKENIIMQSSRKPTGPKTEASEFEVGPVKIENQEVRLTFGFYQTFYGIL